MDEGFMEVACSSNSDRHHTSVDLSTSTVSQVLLLKAGRLNASSSSKEEDSESGFAAGTLWIYLNILCR